MYSTVKKQLALTLTYCVLWGSAVSCGSDRKQAELSQKPNVLVIMVDDLNDNVGFLGGHPQAKTPNMDAFAKTSATFTRAYTTAPMCGPSRASMFTGIFPHNSNNFFQKPWYDYKVLNNSRTLMEQFKSAGYNVMGTGKILHHNKKELWSSFENEADYSPTPFDGEKQVPHPDVPVPFSNIGWVDGSLGPLINLEGRNTTEGKPLHWTTGNPKLGFAPMRYVNDENRDPTPDEVNAKWTAEKIEELAKNKSDEPFFLAVGFLRPHTPLIAPQKYFDLFPLEELDLVIIKQKDAEDTHLQVAYQGDVFTLRFGKEMFEAITEAYGSTELGLKKWTQAYLACVSAVDDNIGQVLMALDNSSLKENTIVVLASDHGFHMGEKEYLYKNSLWEESTRVPLMIRAPGTTKAGSQVKQTVSLIDVYPSLLDLCKISTHTRKNEKGHALDGNSMRALLENPNTENWNGAAAALTTVYAGPEYENDAAMQHYAIRNNRYRYILYNNGLEELYDHGDDPHEWINIAETNKSTLKKMRDQLQQLVAPISLTGFSKTQIEI